MMKRKIFENKRKNLRIILENELDKAETILAVKYINEQLTKLSQQITDIMGKDIVSVSDKISQLWSSSHAEKFNEIVLSESENILNCLRKARTRINDFMETLENKVRDKNEKSGDFEKLDLFNNTEIEDDVSVKNFEDKSRGKNQIKKVETDYSFEVRKRKKEDNKTKVAESYSRKRKKDTLFRKIKKK
ncbi:MAG: hypothetical protein NZZ41_00285 [Candidatus Dojkabacteria bacterium]|nr:hypothetical protein [Candidatus Dojkabacteria bacterium]